MHIPSNMMNRAGGKWHGKLVHVSGFMDFLNPAIQDLIWPADLIIFQRNIVNRLAWNAIDYWHGMEKPIAIDLDDAYQILPYSNPAWRFWHDREDEWQGEMKKGAALDYLEEGLRRCGALIAPNRNLLTDWSHVCNGYYLQNYAEPDWWSDLPDRETVKKEKGLDGKIVIGWGGSVSHYDSFWGSGIMEAAERICKRHSNVVWQICGNDHRIHDQLPVPYDQKYKQPGVPPEQWPKSVVGFDIGVAPLYGIYDQRRSWIKGLEYCLASTPWVGTAGEVYNDIGFTGTLVTQGVDNWERAIEDKITNLKAEQDRMKAALPEARKMFLVDHNLDKYEATYKKIIQDFQGRAVMLPGILKLEGQAVSGQ